MVMLVREAVYVVNVPVNENIDEYKVTVFAGLTAVQIISAIASVFAGGIEFLILHMALGIDITVCSFLILPTVTILVFGINFKKDELNIIEYTVQGRWKKGETKIGYQSTESSIEEEVLSEIREGYAYDVELSYEKSEQQKEKEFKAMAKKMIAATLLFSILLVGLMVAIIVIVL